MSKKVITSEFVSYGHPDKIADQISDAILDAFLIFDTNVRTGIEVMVKDNVVVLGGEVNSKAHVDYDNIVRSVFSKLNFPKSHHLNPENIKIINLIGQQSPEIHNGVDRGEDVIGAGDQGFVVGFATNETPEFMPLGYYIAKKICQYVSSGIGEDFGPDVKSQVVVEYDDDNNSSVIKSILVSSMHQCSIDDARRIIRNAILNNWCGIDEKIFNKYIDGRIDITINPCGTWNIGGPISDCGVTGRKIVVDQYGGYCNVGGGAFSGKDMTKVDRSAAYMARYLAKNIVANGVADTAKVEIAYMIGVPEPVALNIELNRNEDKINAIKEFILSNVDITPSGIMKRFKHEVPRYEYVSAHGHFGDTLNDRLVYPWEITDLKIDIS